MLIKLYIQTTRNGGGDGKIKNQFVYVKKINPSKQYYRRHTYVRVQFVFICLLDVSLIEKYIAFVL